MQKVLRMKTAFFSPAGWGGYCHRGDARPLCLHPAKLTRNPHPPGGQRMGIAIGRGLPTPLHSPRAPRAYPGDNPTLVYAGSAMLRGANLRASAGSYGARWMQAYGVEGPGLRDAGGSGKGEVLGGDQGCDLLFLKRTLPGYVHRWREDRLLLDGDRS